jgi:hypothetical protein
MPILDIDSGADCSDTCAMRKDLPFELLLRRLLRRPGSRLL